jgi:hypothetical protein
VCYARIPSALYLTQMSRVISPLLCPAIPEKRQKMLLNLSAPVPS